MMAFIAGAWLDLLFMGSSLLTGAMAPAKFGIVITGVAFALDVFWVLGEGGGIYQEVFQYQPFRVILILLGILVNHFILDQIRRGRDRIRRACNRECDQCFEAAMGRGGQ